MRKKDHREQTLRNFKAYLEEEEKSRRTVEKYLRDINAFINFLNGRKLDKMLVIEYKEKLQKNYLISSANSMIAALNTFMRFCGMEQYCVRQFKTQRRIYGDERKELSKDEFYRLVNCARSNKDEKTALILETLCGTGIRVSELPMITVEAIQKGDAVVSCKGKTRRVFIVSKLRKRLMVYAKKRGVLSGPVFTNKYGNPIDRCTVWRSMKRLCKQANVSSQKVFPHNLRHLFARVFYEKEKDIAKLADILGHSSIDTTRIYIITTCDEHRRKMENMHLIL